MAVRGEGKCSAACKLREGGGQNRATGQGKGQEQTGRRADGKERKKDSQTEHGLCVFAKPAHRLARRPGDSLGGRPAGGGAFRGPRGPGGVADGRAALQGGAAGVAVCSGVYVRHDGGAGLQRDVRALRPGDGDVLLPQPAHDVRLRHGQQQQAQLQPHGQAGADRHPGGGVPRRQQGQGARGGAQGLLVHQQAERPWLACPTARAQTPRGKSGPPLVCHAALAGPVASLAPPTSCYLSPVPLLAQTGPGHGAPAAHSPHCTQHQPWHHRTTPPRSRTRSKSTYR